MFTTSLEPLSLSTPSTGEEFVFLRSARGGAGLFTFRWTLAPGKKGPPEHTHVDETETFEVISGTLRVWVGDEPRDLGPGMKLSVPPNTKHRFFNPGSEPAVVLVSLDGTRMEDAMIATVQFFGGRKPTAGEVLRFLVHAADHEPSVPTSALVRGVARLVVAVVRRFGVRGFPSGKPWEGATGGEAHAA